MVNSNGPLANDRKHRFKAYVTYFCSSRRHEV